MRKKHLCVISLVIALSISACGIWKFAHINVARSGDKKTKKVMIQAKRTYKNYNKKAEHAEAESTKSKMAQVKRMEVKNINITNTPKPVDAISKFNSLNEAILIIKPNGYTLKQTIKYDIDRDGKQEIVLGFANMKGMLEKIFLLKQQNNVYISFGQLRSEDISFDAPIKYVKLITLRSDGKKQILIEYDKEAYTGSWNPEDKLIVELNNNKVKVLIYLSRPFTGAYEAGHGDIYDINGDGIDELKSKIVLFTAYQEPVTYIYSKWNDAKGDFEAYKTTYGYDNSTGGFIYPQTPKLLIETFLEGDIPNDIGKIVLDKRLLNLNSNYEDYFMYTVHGRVNFDTIIKSFNDNEQIIAAFDVGHGKEIYFDVVKVNNLWKIKNISKDMPKEIGEYYYVNETGIYKTIINGSKEIKISNDKAACDSIFAIDDWIIYINTSDDDKIYKIKKDGAKKVKLSDENCFDFGVFDGWIYYRGETDTDKVYKIRFDGSGRTQVQNPTWW